MRITVAFNLRTDDSEDTAELLTEADVDRICGALRQLRHQVTPVEVTGQPDDVVERLLDSAPDLIFNVAEGTIGTSREAFYPGLYEQLRIPFTGGNPSLLHMNLDKHLAKTVVAARDIRVPRGGLVTAARRDLPSGAEFPLMVKPNAEGSSKGVTQDSVVETPEAFHALIDRLLGKYPAGLVVEEFIPGRELSVPLLESYPGKILDIVEHTFDLSNVGGKYNIYDYDMKQGGERAQAVNVVCPAVLTAEERERVVEMARRVFEVMHCPDLGRVDIRLHDNGQPYFIELNPLPSLHPVASLMTAAKVAGLEYRDVMRLIVRSAARRHGVPLRMPRKQADVDTDARPTARQLGVRVGRLDPGVNNAITDVKGVKVGHVTRQEDAVPVPGTDETACVRTGVTAILPGGGDVFQRRVVAGGFVLNGVGEMAGLTQAMEWGLIETPILLTNSLSVGKVLNGVVSFMVRKHREIGTEDVVLPVVGETDDSFLNDTRIGTASGQDAIKAIESARDGAVVQGSVGAGCGMITCDFAGGIGTSSRVFALEDTTFTLGALVLSNFGRMVNLTVDGRVVGRDLDSQFPEEGRRRNSYGSVIVVLATDVPLLSHQLGRIAKRAALGLGRAGSHAASTSGEIVVAFTTANRVPRTTPNTGKFRSLRFVPDAHIDLLYEAAVETTEEAVLNAIFCSSGMDGRLDRYAPALPQDVVLELIRSGRNIDARH